MEKENCCLKKNRYSSNKRSNHNILNLNQRINKKFVYNIRKEATNTEINSNELVLIYNGDLNSYGLVELCNAQINNNSYIFGLDEYCQLREIKIEHLLKYPENISYNVICKNGILSLSKNHSLLTVDENLNIIKVSVKDVKEGMPILIPRTIEVIEDHSPLDFCNCGEIIIENGIEYVKKARTKAYRYVEKTYELGYILGHYCSEGSMNQVTITCGNQKAEMEKVSVLVEKNFGLSPSIGKHNKNGYDTVYSVDCYSQLGKSIFTVGLGLKSKYAPFKEIPPFLYNAPKECVEGFITSFIEGDGSIEDRIRQNSASRDVNVRLFTSSRKLVFGLNFLLKRLDIVASISKEEFDDIDHPTWYDAYTIRIKGKKNLNILRKFILNVPEYGHYARDIEPVIDLNLWMKKLNNELKETYSLSLRMLSERKKIPYIAARCAQQKSTVNISEIKMLETIEFLKKSGYLTPIVSKLCNIFEYHTFTKVKTIEINYEFNNVYNLSFPYPGIYIAGIGQIYIN